MAQTNNQTVYYRQNGAPVQNKVHIDAVRKQQFKDAVCNNRLGRYNSHGRYTLSSKITKELMGITKYVYQEHFDAVVKESKDTLEFKASANLPVFGNLEFRIVFKDTFAKLYLIENVYREFNGYQEIYGEQITEINCETDREDMIDYVFSLLNVSVVDEIDYGKTEDEEKVVAILTSKIYFSMAARNYLKDAAPDEKETFEDMVNLLKEEGGEYGKRVLRNFIDRIEKRPDIMQLKDEDGYNEALNDALIGALEVATTEDDMLDPAKKDLYDRLYRKRYHKTDDQIKEGQERITERDFNKVAEALLGRERARIFEKEDIASKLDEYARLVDGLKIPPEQPVKEEVKEEIDLLTEIVRARAAGENIATIIKQRGVSKSDPEFLRQMREKAEREAAENAETVTATLKEADKKRAPGVRRAASSALSDDYKANPSKIWNYKIDGVKAPVVKKSGAKSPGKTISTKPFKLSPDERRSRTANRFESMYTDYDPTLDNTQVTNNIENENVKKEKPFSQAQEGGAKTRIKPENTQGIDPENLGKLNIEDNPYDKDYAAREAERMAASERKGAERQRRSQERRERESATRVVVEEVPEEDFAKEVAPEEVDQEKMAEAAKKAATESMNANINVEVNGQSSTPREQEEGPERCL